MQNVKVSCVHGSTPAHHFELVFLSFDLKLTGVSAINA